MKTIRHIDWDKFPNLLILEVSEINKVHLLSDTLPENSEMVIDSGIMSDDAKSLNECNRFQVMKS